MDPTACWQRIVDALQDNNTIEAIDAAIDLAAWLNRGGFMPEIENSGQHTRESYVWAVLTFLLELDPDDELRHRMENEK